MPNPIHCVALFVVLLTVSLINGQDSKSTGLRAGAAAVDISPREFPINMPGGFNANMSTKVHDPFYARSLVMNAGSTELAMVVADNLGIDPEVLEEAKKIASQKTGIPKNRMMICSTHTHSGPPSNRKEGRSAEVAYRSVLVDGLADSIVQAHAALQPASVGAAAHPLPEEVFNRRWYLKPGKMPPNPFGQMDIVKMNPPRGPDVLDRPAGPTDPDVTVVSVRNAQRKPLALFANYSLHYVGATPRGQLSADYFGEFARLMPSRLNAGGEFVAMMSNGTSGDINNIPFGVTRPPREKFEQIRVVAGKAADAAWFAQRKIERHRSDVKLGMKERDIELKHRLVSEKTLARARRIVAMTNKDEIAKLPRLALAYANRTISLAAQPRTARLKLQAIRIGDLAICCIPFETFVEIGLQLKDESPFPQTMVIGLANGRYGYLPTPEQHRLGGYETWLGTNKVQKDASVILVNNLLAMLEELKQ